MGRHEKQHDRKNKHPASHGAPALVVDRPKNRAFATSSTGIKTCAFAGGMYDRARALNRLDDPFEFARNSHIWKEYDKPRLVELHRQCTLEGLAVKIRCPLLVIHGTKDFIPVEQAKRIYDEASGPKEWVLLEGGNHVCNNLPFIYRPMVGDFLAKHLDARVR